MKLVCIYKMIIFIFLILFLIQFNFETLKSKFISILFILSLTIPIGSTFVFLKIQKRNIRKEVKWKMISGIDKDELVLLEFTEDEKKQLKWKHSKEFEFEGEMYDIVDFKTINNTTYYWCWWDHEETKLNKELDELVSFILGTNRTRKKNQENLQHFLKTLFFTKKIETHYYTYLDFNQPIKQVDEKYQDLFSNPTVPPPKNLTI